MVQESELARSQVPGLPEIDLHSLGTLLFDEGCTYNQLPPDKVHQVGTHTSFVLHDFPEGAGRWISIHFRENLQRLSSIGSLVGRVKIFLSALENDLDLLARRLIDDSSLNNVRMIFGLTTLSAAWGRRHGFATVRYSDETQFIRLHDQTIAGNSFQETDRLQPLTLFLITPARFIKEFLIEDSPS